MNTIVSFQHRSFRIRSRITFKSFYLMLLALFWSRDFLCNYIKALAMHTPFISNIADCIIPSITIICVVFAFPYIVKVMRVKDYMGFAVFFLIYFISILVYTNNRAYLMDLTYTIWMTVVPLYFLGLCIKSDKTVRLLYIFSLLNVWSFFVHFALFGTSMDEIQALYVGDMNKAYNLLPHVALIFVFALSKPNVFNIASFILSAIFLLACGTRGAVVCLILYLNLYILLFKRFKQHLVLYAVTGGFVVTIIAFYNQFMELLSALARNIGMSSRIFNRLSDGTFLLSEGRNMIKNTLLQAIAQEPFFGYGIAGDRVLTGQYAHNFVLESLVSYGVIFGSAFVIGVGIIMFMGGLRSKSNLVKAFIVLLICSSFVKLFMTGSYLSEELFFLLLGICVTQIRSNKCYVFR